MKKYAKISYSILKEYFKNVHQMRWVFYSILNRNKEFDITDIHKTCFNKNYSISDVVSECNQNNKIKIDNNKILCFYSTKQYSFCETKKLFELKTIAQLKIYVSAQCNSVYNEKKFLEICQCSDVKTLKYSLEKSDIKFIKERGGIYHLYQSEIPEYQEYINQISEKNINFLKKGSEKIILKNYFWEAQQCFSRCSGNCGVTSYKQAITKSKLVGNVSYDYISQSSSCAYCQKFQNSIASKWLKPIWNKYPVKNIKEFK